MNIAALQSKRRLGGDIVGLLRIRKQRVVLVVEVVNGIWTGRVSVGKMGIDNVGVSLILLVRRRRVGHAQIRIRIRTRIG